MALLLLHNSRFRNVSGCPVSYFRKNISDFRFHFSSTNAPLPQYSTYTCNPYNTLHYTCLLPILIHNGVGEGNTPFNTTSLRGTRTPLHNHLLSGISSRIRLITLIRRSRHIIWIVWHRPMSSQQAIVIMLCARSELYYKEKKDTLDKATLTTGKECTWR